MRVGIAHHFGWAVAVTATPDFDVVDRRRIELIEPGLPAAPVHHEGGTHRMHGSGDPLDDASLATLVASGAVVGREDDGRLLGRAGDCAPGTDHLARRARMATGFPEDIATQRRPPYESRADSVMYCRVLSEVAAARGWVVATYDARTVESDAVAVLGPRAEEVLHGPRKVLGPPWSKDHRTALAATIVTG